VTDRALLHHRLRSIVFVHWPYEAAEVERLLPPGLSVDLHCGRAWVGMVLFTVRMRVRATPVVPWVGTSNQANLRTYVRGPDGRAGVWFLSLDGSRLLPAVLAQWTWSMPFAWSRVDLRREGDTITYDCARRWPTRPAAHGHASVEVGARTATGDTDRFLTDRSLLWGRSRRGLVTAVAEHDTWRLRRARLLDVDPGLLTAAGLAVPTAEPLVHAADEMRVRFGGRTHVVGLPEGMAERHG
jgi:hypothetical protein